ncbi:phenoloxidase-activating enzyme-like isoform X2 [Choristoneura fumiferana]|uniref:phenoloxidase-activating enzyme-like isoform X2 n=1 Tax=Choristoneura fumiferana TaxID=7141 RepID=UPI003D15BF7D
MYQCLFILYVILCQLFSKSLTSMAKYSSAADIDEYPWMAVIEYKKNDTIKLLCSAVLISGQYALSAAQCFTEHARAIGTPVNIRFGEYETNNEGKDCVEVKPGQKPAMMVLFLFLLKKSHRILIIK